MNTKLLTPGYLRDRQLLVLGDTHSLERTYHILKDLNDRNAFPAVPFVVVLLGDCGLISCSRHSVVYWFTQMSKILSQHNGVMLMLRGNHDNPWFFTSSFIEAHCKETDVTTVPDHTSLPIAGMQVALVGGSYSMNWRDLTPNFDYFTDELPVFPPSEATKVDLVLSHQLPSSVSSILITKLATERGPCDFLPDPILSERMYRSNSCMQTCLETYQPLSWFCGHYHCSYNYSTPTTSFSVLDRSELRDIPTIKHP